KVAPLETAALAPHVEVVEPDVVRVGARVINDDEPAAVTGYERVRAPGRRERPFGVLLEQHRVAGDVAAELVQQDLPAVRVRGVRESTHHEGAAVVQPID